MKVCLSVMMVALSVNACHPMAAQKVFPDDMRGSDEESGMEDGLKDKPGITVNLIGLGVDPKVAGQYQGIPSEDLGGIQWRFLKHDKHQTALLFLPCNALGGADIFLLTKEGGWRVTDYLGIDCHYDDSVSLEIGHIHDANAEEILVHQACGEHGTGYVEQSFMVLKPSNGKFETLLKTSEVLHDHQPREHRDLDQQSTFALLPIQGTRARVIEETRIGVLNSSLHTQRRIFRWSQAERRYRPSKFSSVEAPAP